MARFFCGDNLVSRQTLLFNDFGLHGPYLGQMISVLNLLDGQSVVVPVQCDAPFADPYHSAYLLAALVRHGPRDGIWVCVVDPGVGGSRRPLMLRADDRWLIGPDNGLLVPSLREATRVEAWQIDWRPASLSASFHGRDLFAPVAAKLSSGNDVDRTQISADDLVGMGWEHQLSEVIYVDGFGNCMTGIQGGALAGNDVIQLAGESVAHARTFGASAPHALFWYVNSLGLVEIAVNLGSAERRLGVKVGARVTRV